MLFTTGFTSDADSNSPSGRDFLHFLFRIIGFFQLTVSEMKWLLKLYVQVTQVMRSNSSDLSGFPSILLVKDSFFGLSVKMLAISR